MKYLAIIFNWKDFDFKAIEKFDSANEKVPRYVKAVNNTSDTTCKSALLVELGEDFDNFDPNVDGKTIIKILTAMNVIIDAYIDVAPCIDRVFNINVSKMLNGGNSIRAVAKETADIISDVAIANLSFSHAISCMTTAVMTCITALVNDEGTQSIRDINSNLFLASNINNIVQMDLARPYSLEFQVCDIDDMEWFNSLDHIDKIKHIFGIEGEEDEPDEFNFDLSMFDDDFEAFE